MTTPTDLIKVVTPISTIKVVLVTIASVVGVVLLALSMYLFSELKDAKETNGQLKENNAALKQDLALVKLGQTAMGLGQLLSDQEKQDLDKKARDTRSALKLKEQQINTSAATPEEKARQKSEARMDSVWSMYCHVQPTNAICKTGEAK